ncbi:PilZ domain-containing protein [Hahella sp. HN01]|uniref:PilZ domain-containing protein n=1 Tax=unclassified Hahella TaxID=2624107 RepID=UPI001C1EA906|nr:PilZ domain-containing protein [Hahella sp. HN01]MBU6952407.1 PilZ domain-containing protein [Hahella sp. HN01]
MSSHTERRRFERLSASMSVLLDHPVTGLHELKTVDLSEGGVLVTGDFTGNAEVGDLVSLKVVGLLQERSPTVPLKVVRCGANEMALNFV